LVAKLAPDLDIANLMFDVAKAPPARLLLPAIA
jgi:hypothetical protein